MADESPAVAEGSPDEELANEPAACKAPSPGQLPALRSYLMRRSGTTVQPSRVKLEAAQLLPKLRHSQPGIGFYGRVRERAATRATELWTHQQAIGQPTLLLSPSTELTTHYYSPKPAQGKLSVASSSCGHYPFSRVVYSNVTGHAGHSPIGGADGEQLHRHCNIAQHPPQRSLGAFVLRHKVRQSSSCLAKIIDSSNTSDAVVRRAISQLK